jgi:anti-anti-sigma factor
MPAGKPLVRDGSRAHPAAVNDEFRFDLRTEGPDAELKIFGEFDMTGVLRVEPELSRVLEAGKLERLLLDLSGLDFVDSTGLGVIIDLDQRARRGDFELSIVPGPRQVQRVFEVTKLADVLPFEDPPATR